MQVAAAEALGHARCQKANSGLLAGHQHDPTTDAATPALAAAAMRPMLCPVDSTSDERGGDCRCAVRTIWVGERINGKEAPPAGDSSLCVFRGTDTNFCLGGDAAPSKVADGSFLSRLADFETLCERLDSHHMPIVTISHGATRGGGMVFAATATAVLAHEAATFGFPEIHRGVLPGLVSVAAQRRLNAAMCDRLMCMRDAIGAREARRAAFADYVGATEETAVEAGRLISRLGRIGKPLLLQYIHACRRGQPPAAGLLSRREHEGGLQTASSAAGSRLASQTPSARVQHSASPRAAVATFSFDSVSGVAILQLPPRAESTALATFIAAVGSTPSLRASLKVAVLRLSAEDGNTTPPPSARQIARLDGAIADLYRLRVPLIATALGPTSGLSLVTYLAADYRIAADTATFAFDCVTRWRLSLLARPDDQRALLPPAMGGFVGGTQGRNRSAEPTSARHAQRHGIVAEVCESAGPLPRRATLRATAFAMWLAEHSRIGIAHVLDLSRARWRRALVRGGSAAANVAYQHPAAKATVLHAAGSYAEIALHLHGLLAAAACCTSTAAGACAGQSPPVARSPFASLTCSSDIGARIHARRRAATFNLIRTALRPPPTGSRATGGRRVGIHRVEVYIPRHCTSAAAVGAARGMPNALTARMGVELYSSCGPDEDATSLLLTTVSRLLCPGGRSARKHVGMLLVSGGAPADRSKSTKADLMARFEARSPCHKPASSTVRACARAHMRSPDLHAHVHALAPGARALRHRGSRCVRREPRRHLGAACVPRVGELGELGWYRSPPMVPSHSPSSLHTLRPRLAPERRCH